ncbi:Uncharacterised protein [Raoultella terrigena]|nr:Uncharacterised protein [Raoultella terrigena]
MHTQPLVKRMFKIDGEIKVQNIHQKEPTPTRTLLTLNIDNISKTLLKFELRKNGDVAMYNQHAKFYREPGSKPTEYNEIKQQRYSFHMSKESNKRINFFKQTLEVSNDKIINTYIVTPEIKKKSGLVHILSCRSPDMSSDKYNTRIKGKCRTLSLGECNSKSSTLFYSLFIGSSDMLIPRKTVSANTLNFVVGKFIFFVTWGYLPIPSHYTGNKIHSRTIKTDTGEVLGHNEGLNTYGAIKLSFCYFNDLIDEYDQTLHFHENLPLNAVTNLYKSTGLLKDGRRSSIERSKIYKRMYADGILIKFI